MVDITEISAVVAAAGVLVGVVFTVLELRHLAKQRQTDLVTRLSYDISTSREFLEAFVDTFEVEFKDYDDFVKRYGRPISRNQVPMSFMMMGNFFEQIGVLFKNRLIDASLIDQLFPVFVVWEKMKPLVEGMRKEYHNPGFLEWFEYLYNEMRKREQRK
ncbi:MAG: hypothetical protein ABSG57_12880 [Candidatus Bathyarchaeia archaeon]